MSDFLWVIPRDKALSLGEIGVSSSYIIPRSIVGDNLDDLVDGFIWVVLRGDSDRLVLVIKVQEIECILDGYYKHDFLVRPNLKLSLKIGSTFTSIASYEISFLPFAEHVITKITSAVVEKLIILLTKNITVRLISPTNNAFSNFLVELPSKNQAVLTRVVGENAVSHFNFIDIWSDGKSKKFSTAPYASMAKAYIEKNFPSVNLLQFEDVLLGADPFVGLVSRDLKFGDPASIFIESANPPQVDIIFKLIDPNNIFARKFTAKKNPANNHFNQIKKTEAAEQKHQDILRDVSRFLITEGVQPFHSNSVDLAYKSNGCLYIFEIKTSNCLNMISQASKAAFQLAYYKNSLSLDYESITYSLLIEDSGSENLNSFIFETMKTLGMSTFIYREGLNWPSRVSGLPINK